MISYIPDFENFDPRIQKLWLKIDFLVHNSFFILEDFFILVIPPKPVKNNRDLLIALFLKNIFNHLLTLPISYKFLDLCVFCCF